MREAAGRPAGIYKSAHWDEPNVLAHVRFNERADADGNSVLFIEEVQSDWHQEGRKKGYKDTLPPGYRAEQNKYGRWRIIEPDGSIFGGADTREEILNQFNKSAVPPAPFAKTWHEFVLNA